jgi:hypothetical protein
VGAQQTVQNPPASVRDVRGARLQQEQAKTIQQMPQQQQRMQPPNSMQPPQQQRTQAPNNMQQPSNMQQQSNMQTSTTPGRGGNIASSMSIPPNTTESNGRPVVNPAQLLLQHDYRLFQIEKLVKSIHENTSKEEMEEQVSKEPNANAKPKVNMEEIKGAVSESIYESEKLKMFVQEEVRSTIEASYDFDSFYENLQKVSDENSALKDTIMSNQKYINEMNSVLLKLLTEFRELHSIVRTIKPSILETIDEAEELIDEHKKENGSEADNGGKDNDEDNDEANDDEPDEEAEEERRNGGASV